MDKLECSVEVAPGGVLYLRFAGAAGDGSAGNSQGAAMRQEVERALSEHPASGLVLDLRAVEYRFGNWIAEPALASARRLGAGRVWVLAEGETLGALRSLWRFGRLEAVVRLTSSPDEAIALPER